MIFCSEAFFNFLRAQRIVSTLTRFFFFLREGNYTLNVGSEIVLKMRTLV